MDDLQEETPASAYALQRQVGGRAKHPVNTVSQPHPTVQRRRPPPANCLVRVEHLQTLTKGLVTQDGTVARLTHRLLEQRRWLTAEIHFSEAEISALGTDAARSQLAIPGCQILNAAKILAEVAGIRRFRSEST